MRKGKIQRHQSRVCGHRIGIFDIVIPAIAILLLLPQAAYAYLDPGTGALIVQVVAGVILGAIVTFKLWWSRLVGLFRKRGENAEEDKTELDEKT